MNRRVLTFKFDLPGGQGRLREMILYVSEKCAEAPFLGKVKLNKILWKADFDAFAERGIPVTGRAYQKLNNGPAPVEMPPVLGEMEAEGVLEFRQNIFPGGKIEYRPVGLRPARLGFFSGDDLRFVDDSIRYFWNMTAVEASDASHGLAWKSQEVMDPLPYELSYLADRQAPPDLIALMRIFAEERGLKSA